MEVGTDVLNSTADENANIISVPAYIPLDGDREPLPHCNLGVDTTSIVDEANLEAAKDIKAPYPGISLTIYEGACEVIKKVAEIVKVNGRSALPDLNSRLLSRSLSDSVKE